MKFTMEIKKNNQLSFLEVVVHKQKTTVYRKPTNNSQYLHLEFNHILSTNLGVAKSL